MKMTIMAIAGLLLVAANGATEVSVYFHGNGACGPYHYHDEVRFVHPSVMTESVTTEFGYFTRQVTTKNAATTLRTNTFVRGNAKFLGWSKSLNGPVAYADGATIKISADLDL